MELYPLKFDSLYKRRIWGGQRLAELFGKDLPTGEKIGESWELSDLPEDKSVIANGEFKGMTLSEAVKKYPKEITGDENFKLPFPLLIKFLDAQDILSVQVHPSPETCKRMGKGDPKTECWYIIDAQPGAFIYKGLKEGVTKQQFEEAIKDGTVKELLQKVEVNVGECHFLPAGTAHSIGAGLIIAEIQTPSDTTYRVFDFNRLDDSGKPRPLHIAEALESINFEHPEPLPVTTIGRLVDSSFFKIDKGHLAANCEFLLSPEKMKILIILTGGGNIISREETETEFKAGECILIPADFMGAMTFTIQTHFLIITL